MSRAVLLLVILAGADAATETVASYDQGAKWSGKCIKVTDFNTKDQDGDLEVVDRDANGCCPTDYIPGIASDAIGSYVGAQIICGIGSDGTVTAFSSSTSNGVTTCTYGDCYVVKQSTPCTDGTKVLVNGCCGAVSNKADTLFKDKCEKYLTSGSYAGESGVNYCKSYHTSYTLVGTSVETDDIADSKLVFSGEVDGAGKYLYTPCEDSGIPGVTSTGEKIGGGSSNTAVTGDTSALVPSALIASLCLATWL